MALYTFSDAKNRLKARTGHRADVTDSDLGRFINQAQLVMAQNLKGLEVFDKLTPAAITIQPNISAWDLDAPVVSGGLGLTDLFAIQDVQDVTGTTVRRIRRGEWDQNLNVLQKPKGPPTIWYRRLGSLFFNTVNDQVRNIGFIYRRVPTVDVLEVGDENFEHLLNLASIYLYPEIGRLKERDTLFQRLPIPLQLAVTNPMTSAMFEATCDVNLATYVDTYA